MTNVLTYEKFKNADFKKWFGNSKLVDNKGFPIIMYHGSPSINQIEVFESEKGYHFFSNSKDEAARYTATEYNGWQEDLNNIKSYYIRAEKIFNPQNLNELEEQSVKLFLKTENEYFYKILLEKTDNGILYEFIFDMYGEECRNISDIKSLSLDKVDFCYKYLLFICDNYILLEDIKFQKYIRSNGYDSFQTIESGGGDINIAVYDSNQIKSTKNSGLYSKNSKNVYECIIKNT